MAQVVDSDARLSEVAVVVTLEDTFVAEDAVVAAGGAESLTHNAGHPRPVRDNAPFDVSVGVW